jgi:pyridoxine 5-phosphate synthase
MTKIEQPAIIELGVNVDHVATLRQARGTIYPDPVMAAKLCAQAGADGITIHLREDRRHIQDNDLERMLVDQPLPVNLEMANTDEMLSIALKRKPREVCLVPEKREELTTEGGLNVIGELAAVKETVTKLQAAGIKTSLFINANKRQLDAAAQTGTDIVELHTGAYADAQSIAEREQEFARIVEASTYADELGIQVNAGHGLHYENVQLIAEIPELACLNIGHSIISRSVMMGIDEAVGTMKLLIAGAPGKI